MTENERLLDFAIAHGVNKKRYLTMDEIVDRLEICARYNSNYEEFDFKELTCRHIDELKETGFRVNIVTDFPNRTCVIVSW